MTMLSSADAQLLSYSSAIICAVFGLVVVFAAQIIAVSQLIVIARTRNTSGTSILTYIFFIIMSLVCLTWGLSFYFQSCLGPEWVKDAPPVWLHQWTTVPLLVYYTSDLFFAFTIVIIKARHMILAKKLNMTELQLADYLKKNQQYRYIHSKYKVYWTTAFSVAVFIIVFYILLAAFAILFTWYTEPLVGSKSTNQHYPWVIPLGILGSFAWEAVSWPQFIKCIRQRDTSGISTNWSVFLPISCTISCIYAIFLAFISGSFSFDTIGGIIFNGMIVNYGILIIKVKNKKKAKALNMTEMQYTQKYIIPAYEQKQKLKQKRA